MAAAYPIRSVEPLTEIVQQAILKLDPQANLERLALVRGDDLGIVLGAVLYAHPDSDQNAELRRSICEVAL